VSDPDHTSAVVDVVDRELAQRFLMWRAGTIRNGWIAHHMRALMKEVGFQEIDVTPMVNIRTDYAEVERTSSYDGGVRVAQRDGVFSTHEADSLIASLRAAAASDSFFCAMTFFITSGTKP
jgi:hypothetical protein